MPCMRRANTLTCEVWWRPRVRRAPRALLAAVTAFVPNLLGKLLQYSALENLFDSDLDYNVEIRTRSVVAAAVAPGIMTPTVTYLGMAVAHDMGARSFLPRHRHRRLPATAALRARTSSRCAEKVMYAALLVASGLNLLNEHLKTRVHGPAAEGVPARRRPHRPVRRPGHALGGRPQYAADRSDLHCAICRTRACCRRDVAARALQGRAHDAPSRTCSSSTAPTVLIVHLHGMIFFGSANSVSRRSRRTCRRSPSSSCRCASCSSTSTAARPSTRRPLPSSSRRAAQIRDAGLIFACAGADVLAMLNRGSQKEDREFEHFTTLDLALEQCENQVAPALRSAEHRPINLVVADDAQAVRRCARTCSSATAEHDSTSAADDRRGHHLRLSRTTAAAAPAPRRLPSGDLRPGGRAALSAT